MASSNRFRELKARLRELRIHMLPNEFSSLGDYSDRKLDRARGYRVLAHAEIESYLEDVCKKTITDAIRDWKNNGKPSHVLVSFLACYHSGWENPELSEDEIISLAKNRKKVKIRTSEAIDAAQKQMINIINNNHGVKEKNLNSLFIPTGLDVQELDTAWISNMDSFGSKRGESAHKTSSATGQINPKDELEAIQSLLTGLEELDTLINDLAR